MPAFSTWVDIANSAAGIIGADPIVSATGSKFAILANTYYDQLREAELRRNTWTHSIKRAILRPIDITTQTWTPAAYASGTTYAAGAVVVSGGDWWESKVGSNTGNTPVAGSTFWRRYFGPDSFDPFSAPPSTAAATPAAPTLSSTSSGSLGAATYYVKITYSTASGETLPSSEASLAVAANNVVKVTSPSASTGATAWNVYVSTVQGEETLQSATISIGTDWTEPTTGLVIGQFPPSSVATRFHPGELTTYGGNIYRSLVDNNLDTPPTQNWLNVGGTGTVLQILYPINTGPRVDRSTNNVFRLPHGYLRKAPTDPKGSMYQIVGAPTGPAPEDYTFESGYIISASARPIPLRFVANVVDVTDFDAEFCELLAARLALKTCEPVTQSKEKLDEARATYGQANADALQSNGIEVGTVASPVDDWILARY